MNGTGRIRSIDAFRGIAIVLMVFFTLFYVLCNDPPSLLKHNVPGEFHFGDLVLPMFLFASGMSLVFFVKKRKEKKRADFVLDIIERFMKLFFVSMFLSPFSAGGMLYMDVIMLSVLLFLGTIAVSSWRSERILALAFCIFSLYVIMQAFGITPIWVDAHLGGYPAAVFYFPVMLSGMIFGRFFSASRAEYAYIRNLFIVFAVMFVFFSFFTPLDKMSASPSFMILSILLSMLAFLLLYHVDTRNLLFRAIEWLGRKPLRYWVMMFVFFVIPILYYATMHRTYPLGFHWTEASAISVGILIVLALLSFIFDRIENYVLSISRSRNRNQAIK